MSSCTEGRSLNALCMDTGYRHWRIAFVLSWGCLFLVCLYEIHPLEKLLSLSTSTWHHGKRPEWCEQVKVSQGELVMNLCLFALQLQLNKHKSHFGRGSFPCVIFFRNLRLSDMKDAILLGAFLSLSFRAILVSPREQYRPWQFLKMRDWYLNAQLCTHSDL